MSNMSAETFSTCKLLDVRGLRVSFDAVDVLHGVDLTVHCGLIHALKEQYPTAQFLPLDYDPDVSFANVENRLQMLIMNAKAQGCGEAHGETA